MKVSSRLVARLRTVADRTEMRLKRFSTPELMDWDGVLDGGLNIGSTIITDL